jgi:hypothetical protein
MAASPDWGVAWDQAAADRLTAACQRVQRLVGRVTEDQQSLAATARDQWIGTYRDHFDQQQPAAVGAADRLLADLNGVISALARGATEASALRRTAQMACLQDQPLRSIGRAQ